MILLSPSCFSHTEPIFGLYYDNIHHLNVRYGVSIYSDQLTKALQGTEPFNDNLGPQPSKYFYGDMVVGLESQAFSVGIAHYHYAANQRWGISAINQGDRKLYGFETVMSALFISLKAGLYQNPENDDVKFMVGAGFGW